MKTKIIPFDLETAKKIQAGEIDGKIKTRCGYAARILCTDLVQAQPVLAAFVTHELESVSHYTKGGRFYLGIEKPHELDLVLEVPDNEPMFNVGDTVSINIINSSYDADFRARYHSKLATVLFTNKYGAGVKTIISGDENYFSFNELIFVRRNTKEPQFKPFDKVLVRNVKSEIWRPSLYAREDVTSHYRYECIGCKSYHYCIPYEGNEHLVGTTDKPKEE